MYRCQLVNPDGSTRPLDTVFLGDTRLSTAAAMVAQEIGDRTQPDEIYFFALRDHELSPERAYHVCSQNSVSGITPERLAAYLANIVGLGVPPGLTPKNNYTYTDLVGLGLTGTRQQRYPLSIGVSADAQYPVPANPYDWISNDPTIAQDAEAMVSHRGGAVLFDTPIADAVVFCCAAKDVLGATQDRAVADNLARVYFPLMAARGIRSSAAIRASHANEATPTPPSGQNQALAALEFAETAETAKIGVVEYSAIFHPDLPVHVPLELLFRSIPASANLPFIKFNMGRGRARLYRLYAPPGRDGTKQPSLSAKQINRLQAAVAMQEGVGYVVLSHDALCTLDLSPNADLRLRIVSRQAIPLPELAKRLNDMMGSALTQLNAVLVDTGFRFPERFGLEDEGVEVQGVMLRGTRPDVERFTPTPIVSCLPEIVHTTDVNDSVAEMVYHRVGYYNTMTAVEKYITTQLRQARGVRAVVAGVERGFGMSPSDATAAVQNWAQKAQEELAAHANQRLRIATSGGIDITMQRDRRTREATITSQGVFGIAQARLLAKYMTAILAASCASGAAERFKQTMGTCDGPGAASARIGAPEAPAAASIATELEAPAAPATVTVAASARIVADEDDDDDLMDDLLDLYGDDDDFDGDGDAEDVQEAELDELLAEEPAGPPPAAAAAPEPTPTPADAAATPSPKASAAAAAPAPAPTPTAAPAATPRGSRDVAGMSLTGPNYFQRRLKARDPRLFVSTQTGRYRTYSRMCPHNLRRQPVVLTEAEKERMEREAPDSFDPSGKALLKHGSGDGPPNWYMCPRYWCLKTDLPMTKAQVDAGECGGKIIPYDAKSVPDDAFIFQFDSEGLNNEHLTKDKRYATHYPGFLDPAMHPDGLCVPCCFKDVSKAKMIKRMQECSSKDSSGPKTAQQPKRVSRFYVKDANKYPLSAGDVGFLTPAVQKLLGTDNAKCTVSERDKTIATNVRCVLRGGVGGTEQRSFVAAVAAAAGIPEAAMVDKLIKAVTPKTIGRFQEGTLVASLTPHTNTPAPTNPPSPLATDANRERQATRLREQAVERLHGMLRGPDTGAGYQYMWDVVRQAAFGKPINLLVLLLDEEDGTDNPKLLCPAAVSGSPQHDRSRGTLVLLRKRGYYEPVMVYRASATGGEAPLAPVERLLGLPESKMPEVQAAVNSLGDIANGCGRAVETDPVPDRATTEQAIARVKGRVLAYVVSFGGRVVGLHVSLSDGQKLVVPIAATGLPEGDPKLEMVGAPALLAPLDATLAAIKAYSDSTGLRLAVHSIVAESGAAVAVQTVSDRVIPVRPSPLTGREGGDYRGYPVVDVPTTAGVVETEAVSVLGTGQDTARLAAAAAIRVHSETYELFRAWLRARLLDPQQVPTRQAIAAALQKKASVGERMRIVASALTKGVGKEVETVRARGGAAAEAAVATDGSGVFYLPESVFSVDDVMLRAADEIVRYPNAGKFIMGRTMFYSTQPGEYTLRDDELVLPEAMLTQQVRDLSASGLMRGVVGPSAALSYNIDVLEEAVVSEEPVAPGPAPGPASAPAPAQVSVTAAGPAFVLPASPRTASPKRKTPTGCAPLTRKPIGPHDKLRKAKSLPAGAVRIETDKAAVCVWELIALGLSEIVGRPLGDADIRGAVSRGYQLQQGAEAAASLKTWKAEGKMELAKRASPASGQKLAFVSKEADYYPTNVDLYYLALAYGVTITIVSSATNKQTGSEFITYGEPPLSDGKFLLLKRGAQRRNTVTPYAIIASPGQFVLRTLPPALHASIEANRLSNPNHAPVVKAVLVPAAPAE